MDELAKPTAKHVFTVYRKSSCSPDTANDIYKVLLGELQALQHGRKPLPGQEAKALSEQTPGEYLRGNWGRFHRVCLMQVRMDGACLVECLGVRPWNSLRYMCPWCRADATGPNTWRDFSLDAGWLRRCRAQERFFEDMAASQACNFRRGSCAFSFCSALLSAPFSNGVW